MASQEKLADTQPMEVDNTTPSPPSSQPWAWLVQLGPARLPSHPLNGENITVGRESSCTLQVSKRIFDNSNTREVQFIELSRVHFEIKKEVDGISLQDMSMNGTFVNQMLVGKANSFRLNHGDIISVLKNDFGVFLFLSEKKMNALYSPSLLSKYLVGREVGRGSFAVVREGYIKGSDVKVAMKFISKRTWPSQYGPPKDIMMEVQIVQELDHPCIAKVYDALEEETELVIVMEFAEGGEMFYKVVAEQQGQELTEEKAKIRFYQMSHTLAYLHSRKVCHRDLKLENILLVSQSSSICLLKVTDFGLSKKFSSINQLETYVGTPMYMAPEIIYGSSSLHNTPYTCKSDCWSLGVILYILLCGHPPFRETPLQPLLSLITSGQVEHMVGTHWDKVTAPAKDLVMKLLVTDPDKRLSSEEILGHKWFVEDMEVVERAKEIMGLVDRMIRESDSGVGSLQQTLSVEDRLEQASEKKGEKRKTMVEDVETGKEGRKKYKKCEIM